MSYLVNGVRLKHFQANEFIRPAVKDGPLIDWSTQMDRRLLLLLDALRNATGKRLRISQGDGTLGRYGGTSRHAVDVWGTVMAADTVPDDIRGMADAHWFFRQAVAVGFGGIGFYPQWNQGPGFHLDTRINPDGPSTWGHIDGKYVSLDTAFDWFRANPRV